MPRLLIYLMILTFIMTGCRDKVEKSGIIYSCSYFTVGTDSVIQDNSVARALSPFEFQSNIGGSDRYWRVDSINPRFPSYNSPQPLIDALYNMSVSRLSGDCVSDSLVIERLSGLTTRQLSYAIYMSLALIDPDASVKLLRSRVKDGSIIREFGTGGGWPVIADQISWTMAAWEVYNVTGDKDWLDEAFHVVDRALKNARMTVYDNFYSLIHGKVGNMDNDICCYPDWSTPVDLYESMCLSVNVAYSRAFLLASVMAEILDIPESDYKGRGRTIATNINDRLWIPNYGYYSEYLYGGSFPIQSYTTDNFGQAIAVLFDIASPEMAGSIISKTPQSHFGAFPVFPLDSRIKSYSSLPANPLTQGLWNMASAKTGNPDALAAGLGALYRAVSEDLSLCSSLAVIAMNLRVFFGIDITEDAMEFHPMILPVFSGEKQIRNLRYRDALLDITLSGTGNTIAGFSIDGQTTSEYRISSRLKGYHNVVITMANNSINDAPVNIGEPVYSPPVPIVNWTDSCHVTIGNFDSGLSYGLYLNGVFREKIDGPKFRLWNTDDYRVTNLVAVAGNRWMSYSCIPQIFIPYEKEIIVRAGEFATGGTRLVKDKKIANDFVELNRRRNTHLTLYAEVDTASDYLITVHYSNGNGPVNAGDKCAVRTLFVNGKRIGTIVMPQRGRGEWLNTGFSNSLKAYLKTGLNILAIDYVIPYNENADGRDNTALIDYIRLVPAP